MSKPVKIFAILLVVALAYWLIRRHLEYKSIKTEAQTAASQANLESVNQQNLAATPTPSEQQEPVTDNTQAQVEDESLPVDDSAVITLTPTNFEKLVPKCFSGHACQLSEDAWRMYQEFKLAGNNHVTDLYISYLR